MIRSFEDWNVSEEFSQASGASEKEWLVNDKNEIGLFKFPKSEATFEHFSEKIAHEIASKIGLASAVIDIGYYENRLGSISYLINDSSEEELIEGVTLISKNRVNYDMKNLQDIDTKEYYSFYMILEAIESYNIKNDFFKVVIFDYLIGNTDRHHSNWGILQSISDKKEVKLSPIYDNGSSLCCYIKEEDIRNKKNDLQWFNAILESKSTSIIRIDKLKKKKPKHIEVIMYLKQKFYSETISFVKIIKDNLTESEIEEIIETYSYNVLSEERKDFLKKYLKEKVKKLLEIYNEL